MIQQMVHFYVKLFKIILLPNSILLFIKKREFFKYLMKKIYSPKTYELYYVLTLPYFLYESYFYLVYTVLFYE